MPDEPAGAAADGTAVRVALWRALHVQADPPPHVLEDEVGLKLAAPEDGWRNRGDMLALAREAGFRGIQHVPAAALAQRYLAGRTDGLRPPSNSGELLVATT